MGLAARSGVEGADELRSDTGVRQSLLFGTGGWSAFALPEFGVWV